MSMLVVQKPRRSRAGCVPVIRNEEGEIVSVLLVTSGQFQGKYILPAGKVEDSDLRLEEAALRELREEAGVQGVVCRDVGTCSFPCDTRWFLCEFQGICEQDEWPERRHRQRRLFSVEEAANELLWKPWMMLVLHAAVHELHMSPNNVTSMRAASLWNGFALPTEHSTCMSLVLHPSKVSSVVLAIQSTDHSNPIPLSPPDLDGTDGLWNYEVSEVFVSGSDGYIELEVGPGGHVLLLDMHPPPAPPCSVRRGIGHVRATSAMVFHTDTSIMEPNPEKERKNEWVGVIELPLSLLPQPPLSANLVSIFTHGEQRIHVSAVLLPGDTPNFHQPDAFAPISLPLPLYVASQ